MQSSIGRAYTWGVDKANVAKNSLATFFEETVMIVDRKWKLTVGYGYEMWYFEIMSKCQMSHGRVCFQRIACDANYISLLRFYSGEYVPRYMTLSLQRYWCRRFQEICSIFLSTVLRFYVLPIHDFSCTGGSGFGFSGKAALPVTLFASRCRLF